MHTPIRPISSKDLKAVYDHLGQIAANAFNTDGELDPVLLVVSLGPAEGSIASIQGIPDALTKALQRDARGKDAMMVLVATLLKEDSKLRESMLKDGFPRPDILVHLTEAWTVMGTDAKALGGRAVSEHPGRGECITVQLHTSFGTTFQMMPVDPQTRKVVFLPFREEAGTMVGRMQVASWLGDDPDKASH